MNKILALLVTLVTISCMFATSVTAQDFEQPILWLDLDVSELFIPTTGSTSVNMNLTYPDTYTDSGEISFEAHINPNNEIRTISDFGSNKWSGEVGNRYSQTYMEAQYVRVQSTFELETISFYIKGFSTLGVNGSYQLTFRKGTPWYNQEHVETINFTVSEVGFKTLVLSEPYTIEPEFGYTFIWSSIEPVTDSFILLGLGDDGDGVSGGGEYFNDGGNPNLATGWPRHTGSDIRMVLNGTVSGSHIITPEQDEYPFLDITLSPLNFTGNSPHNFTLTIDSFGMYEKDEFDIIISAYDSDGRTIDVIRIASDGFDEDSDGFRVIEDDMEGDIPFAVQYGGFITIGILVGILAMVFVVYKVVWPKDNESSGGGDI